MITCVQEAIQSTPHKSGSVSREGDVVVVRFRYSEQRFAAIKTIRGARFDKEKRCWRLPLLKLPELAELPDFSPEEISYELDVEAAGQELSQHLAQLEAAQTRARSNPFAVDEADIVLLRPDIVFRLNEHGLLRAQLGPKSRAKKHLEAIPGVHFLKRERSFFISPHHLPSFLKALRDAQVSFAVEASAGAKLKQGASIRAQLAELPFSAEDNELATAMLYPQLIATSAGSLALVGWTTEQLKDSLSHIQNFTDRKAKASHLTIAEAAQAVFQATSKGHRIWLSAPVYKLLLNYAQQPKHFSAPHGIEDSILSICPPPCFWTTTPDLRGALVIAHDCFDATLRSQRERWADSVLAIDPRFPKHHLLAWRSSLLREAIGRLSDIPDLATAPRSLSFAKYMAELIKREDALRVSREYHALKDTPLQLSDSNLAERLFPHQRVAVKWLLSRNRGILGDDMGLGKTLSILTTMQELKDRGALTKALIICPNSLVRNWLRECAQWTPRLKLLSLPSGKSQREQFLDALATTETFDGIVVNFESARLDHVHPLLARLYATGENFLCIDESQRIKNPQSKAFEVMRLLAEKFERRFLLSGTPTPKELGDIWGQMRIVDDGARFGTNYYEWLQSVAELGNKYSDFAVRRYLPEQIEETTLRIHEVLLRRAKEEVINLPPKIFSVRDLELSSSQKKRYDEIRNELLLRVRTLDGKDYVRSIDSILEEYLRAVQVASNPRLIDPEWKGDPVKFTELDSLVDEMVRERGEKLVVWTNYLGNIDELVARYQSVGAAAFSGKVSAATRQATIQTFQDRASKLKVLIAIPAAGGVGITLTAAQTAVYIDKTWNAEHWMQSVDRIHRIGQTGLVNIISLQACKVDELIALNLRRKELNQERLLTGTPGIDQSLHPSREELLEALSR